MGYINKEAFKRKLIDEKSFFPAIVARALEEMPAADVVPMEVYKQVAWERDVAIEQLESYGVGFGENKELTEVKHGEWIESFSFDCWHYDCSLCGEGYATKEKDKTPPNFCQDCGAIMDGGKKE